MLPLTTRAVLFSFTLFCGIGDEPLFLINEIKFNVADYYSVFFVYAHFAQF